MMYTIIKRRVAARSQVSKFKKFQSQPLLVEYANIPEVKLSTQDSRQLCVRLHLWRHVFIQVRHIK